MQSSKKAAKCATPLILNTILPKCHSETRVRGYYKSEGIKNNCHLHKGVKGHGSCHTHTINWVKFDLPVLLWTTEPWPSLPGGEIRGLLASWRVQVDTHNYRTCRECYVMGYLLTYVQRRKTSGNFWQVYGTSKPQFPYLSKGLITYASMGVMSIHELSRSEHLAWCPAHRLHPLNGNYYLYFHLLVGGRVVPCA